MRNGLLIMMLSVFTAAAGILKTGDKSPDFSLKNEKGATVKAETFRDSSWVLLVFYPGDNTPVCSKQLCEINDNYALLQEKGVAVFGVNPADAASHEKFSAKYGYQFNLLVDEGAVLAKAFGVKGLIGTKRSVFLIDPKGVIRYASKGKPKSAEILTYMQ